MIDFKVLEKAIEKWGPELQTIVAIEELSELQKELTKNLRGKKNREAIIEEVADVEIMLRQIMIMHDIKSYQIDEQCRLKITRLKGLLE